jgi:hypothetical protein
MPGTCSPSAATVSPGGTPTGGERLTDDRERLTDLENGPVQIPDMVLAEVADGLPEIRLAQPAEDLGSGARAGRIFASEQQAPAPHAVVGPAHHDPDRDVMAPEPE